MSVTDGEGRRSTKAHLEPLGREDSVWAAIVAFGQYVVLAALLVEIALVLYSSYTPKRE